MGEAPRCGGSTSAFSVEIPAAGLCLLGEFFEQPWSGAPSRGAVATAHPRPLPLHVTPTSQSAAASRSAGARGPGRRAGGLGGGGHSGCERFGCRLSFRAQESARLPSWKLQPPQDRGYCVEEKNQPDPGLWSQPTAPCARGRGLLKTVRRDSPRRDPKARAAHSSPDPTPHLRPPIGARDLQALGWIQPLLHQLLEQPKIQFGIFLSKQESSIFCSMMDLIRTYS